MKSSLLFFSILNIIQCSIQNRHFPLDNSKFVSSPTTSQLAQNYGYRCEEHKVVTNDGYILTIHRLTGRALRYSITRNSPTVLLMHGIFSSSTHLVLNGEYSPAGILSDHGFDVWVGNSRGTRYSRNHTRLNPNSSEFWSFNYNQMAFNDFPAIIDYILDYAGKKSLHHVGYSQGGILLSGLLAHKPEYNKKIKSISYVASATHTEIQNRQTFLQLPFEILDKLSKRDRSYVRPFPIYSSTAVQFLQVVCNKHSPFFKTCISTSESFLGKDDGLDFAEIPTWIEQSDSISLYQAYHFAQRHVKGTFRYFDYGPKGNMRIYGMSRCPGFDFFKILPPKLFIYSADDRIIRKNDVFKTINAMINVERVIELSNFSHIGFLFRCDLKEKVYDAVADHIINHD